MAVAMTSRLMAKKSILAKWVKRLLDHWPSLNGLLLCPWFILFIDLATWWIFPGGLDASLDFISSLVTISKSYRILLKHATYFVVFPYVNFSWLVENKNANHIHYIYFLNMIIDYPLTVTTKILKSRINAWSLWILTSPVVLVVRVQFSLSTIMKSRDVGHMDPGFGT